MRIDKFLHDQQYGSRSEIHELIKRRQVMVDGQPIKSFKVNIDPDVNAIQVSGQLVQVQAPFVYLLLNKPAGVITATHDETQATVMSLIAPADLRKDLSPVGRLDKDTTGMLLLTNDGQLAHQLVSPRHHVQKTYRVTTTGQLTASQLDELEAGITLRDGSQVRADDCQLVEQQADHSIVLITLHQGKYHQIKRMIGYLGQRVTQLDRESFAGIQDSTLELGAYRALTAAEIEQLSK